MKNKLKILFEDKYLIIVSKPEHLLTIANDKEKIQTLYHQVYLYIKRKNKNNKVFIVHRLDFDTSGLIIFAKDVKTKIILQDNWNSVIRKYIAILHGHLDSDKGIIKSYLKETKTNLVYSTNDSKNGLKAITEYRKIMEYNNLTFVEIILKTGRKNQIRVHMNDINHKILGDKKYGIKDKENRMYLHAYYLKFNHPINNKIIEIEDDIPKDFLKKLNKV